MLEDGRSEVFTCISFFKFSDISLIVSRLASLWSTLAQP